MIEERPRPKIMRPLVSMAGFGFLGLGFFGLVTPGVPGFVFLIVALACFARSNPAMEDWMLRHPWFGTKLQRWQQTGAIPKRVKIIAVSCIVLFTSGSFFRPMEPWALLLLAIVAVAGIAYILSRPTDNGA